MHVDLLLLCFGLLVNLASFLVEISLTSSPGSGVWSRDVEGEGEGVLLRALPMRRRSSDMVAERSCSASSHRGGALRAVLGAQRVVGMQYIFLTFTC